MSRPRARRAHRGAAVVMALLIVTLAATLVAGLFWTQHVLARSVENNLAYVQAKWLMQGALDWSRAILREDARTSATDHLGEPWAVPIANTRVTGEEDAEPAYLSGALEDAQARLNLTNLVQGGVEVEREVASLKRLLALLDLSPSVADTIAARLKNAQPIELPNEPRKDPTATAPRRIQDFIGEPGIDASVATRLRPYVAILPTPTPVNANTAPAEVLAARIDGLSLAQARQLVASREHASFKDVQDVLARLPRPATPGTGPTASPNDISAATRYFFARGAVSYRRAELRLEALIARDQGNPVVVWQRESW